MRTHHLGMMALLTVGFLAAHAYAKTSEYNLTIDRLPVNITGHEVEKVTVNMMMYFLL